MSEIRNQNYDRLTEQNRLVVEFITVLAELDICFSSLQNAFANGTDSKEVGATLTRLKAESYQIKVAIDNCLNGGKTTI